MHDDDPPKPLEPLAQEIHDALEIACDLGDQRAATILRLIAKVNSRITFLRDLDRERQPADEGPRPRLN